MTNLIVPTDYPHRVTSLHGIDAARHGSRLIPLAARGKGGAVFLNHRRRIPRPMAISARSAAHAAWNWRLQIFEVIA